MHKYRLIGKKGEGTFSEVLKAQCIKNGKDVAIKCMKNHFDSLDQVRESGRRRQERDRTRDGAGRMRNDRGERSGARNEYWRKGEETKEKGG